MIRTLIQSESTWVPPVTAERSPPDSRMTGADSPVIAASLTEATPSITSPSEGMKSPASTITTSPGRRSSDGHAVEGGRGPRGRAGFFAMMSVRVALRLAAWALPRPSATASAKLAKSSVNQSQRMIWKVKPRFAGAGREVAQEEDGGEERHDLDDEHHRVADHRPRVELGEGRAERGHDDLRREEGGTWVWT